MAHRIWQRSFWQQSFLNVLLPTLMMFVMGAVVLTLTARWSWEVTELLRHAERTTGTVVNETQHQRLRFTDAAGRTVEFVQNGFLDRPLGAAVPVVYDPRDPAGTARADTFWAVWGTVLWLLPLGLGGVLAPVFGVEMGWRPGRY